MRAESGFRMNADWQKRHYVTIYRHDVILIFLMLPCLSRQI